MKKLKVDAIIVYGKSNGKVSFFKVFNCDENDRQKAIETYTKLSNDPDVDEYVMQDLSELLKSIGLDVLSVDSEEI